MCERFLINHGQAGRVAIAAQTLVLMPDSGMLDVYVYNFGNFESLNLDSRVAYSILKEILYVKPKAGT
jgi:hypothetical protein